MIFSEMMRLLCTERNWNINKTIKGRGAQGMDTIDGGGGVETRTQEVFKISNQKSLCGRRRHPGDFAGESN